MSRVKSLVKSTVEAVEGSHPIPEHWKERRVTLRLTGMQYASLRFIALRMVQSPTGCAEELLWEAIQDGVEALGYAKYEDALQDIIAKFNDVEAWEKDWRDGKIPASGDRSQEVQPA